MLGSLYGAASIAPTSEFVALFLVFAILDILIL